MRVICVATVFVLGLLSSLPARAETGFLDRTVKLQGQTYAYQVYVPAGYSPARQWPLVVYLHGNLHQGDDGMRQTNAPFADALREHRAWFPAIVVLPQASTGDYWFSAKMQELVSAELDQTIAEFHVDATRLYLTGFSMGGTGTYCLAYHQHRFAALVVVAGRVEAGPNYTPAEVKTDREANEFMRAPDPFTALAARLKGTPIWILHGTGDEVVSVEQSRRIASALDRAGASVKYTEYPDAKHVEAAQNAYFDPAVIDWMFQQRRSSP